MDNKDLVNLAIKSQKNAYVPYSKFKVGAALVTEDGEIYTGCNIEIASYSPTLCAERTAIFKAVSEGHRKIAKIAVVGDSEFTYPCGVCRQVIREFGQDTIILIANKDGEYKEYKLEDILPYSFGPEDLVKSQER